MAVEVGRYFLCVIHRTDNRTVTVSAGAIGSEASQVLCNLVDVLQVFEDSVVNALANLLNFLSFTFDVQLVFFGEVLHILNLNPTGFAAVLHKLLEISVQLIGSIKRTVAILGIKPEAASICKIFQLRISDSLNNTHLGIVLFKSLGIHKTFLS